MNLSLLSNSSYEYLESAEKMIGEAEEKFKKGLFSSEISYINSAKQKRIMVCSS